VLVRRDNRVKRTVTLDSVGEDVADLLSLIQTDMRVAAFERREANSIRGDITYERFQEVMAGEGAFVYAGWCGGAECERLIKEETKATIRLLPDEEFCSAEAPTRCLKCGQAAIAEALWAKAY
jgi:prolyl-tRNA synthetase